MIEVALFRLILGKQNNSDSARELCMEHFILSNIFAFSFGEPCAQQEYPQIRVQVEVRI